MSVSLDGGAEASAAALRSRPMPFAWWLGLPLACAAALLFFDPSSLDFALARLFYDPATGFAARHGDFLEIILHRRAKQAALALGMLVVAGFLFSLFARRCRAWRRPLGYLALSLGVSTGIVAPLKALTGVHCPWSLSQFGGQETYTPLLSPRAPTDHPGRCWPGGHASSGFSLLAWFFCLRDRRPRLARAALAGALVAGGVLSLGRMMQGAHFLSHNAWTLIFDWLVSLIAYRLVLYRPAAQGATQSGISGSTSFASCMSDSCQPR